ncbi:MAG: nickel insertion protein, partial [Candidatus Sulfotelmatobacter sp.]
MARVFVVNRSSMRIAYLECFSGISGDMFLGALIDAGVSPQILHDTVAALDVGARLEISQVTRSGISATKVDVWVNGEKDLPREEYWEREASAHASVSAGHEPSHSAHAHSDAHSHNDAPSHNHEAERASRPLPHEHSQPHEHGRTLTDIQKIISAAALSERAKSTALAIFAALGQAEAKIHNTSIDLVHFHEVGAVDAMVDIVCAAVGAE